MQFKVRVTDGPTDSLAFAAAEATFSGDQQRRLAFDGLARRCRPLGMSLAPSRLGGEGELAWVEWVGQLAAWAALPEDPQFVRWEATSRQGAPVLAIECFEPNAAIELLSFACELAQQVEQAELLPAHVRLIKARQRVLQQRLVLGPNTALLLRAARERDIPVVQLAPPAALWLFGQGRLGRPMHETASEGDGLPGVMLARNKDWTTGLVRRLGLPATVQRLAGDVNEALSIAASVGYPLVIKPVDRGKGIGVFPGLRNDDEVRWAFAEAARVARPPLIVERHVDGDEHRLAVVGGTLAWVVARLPPEIRGDGQSSIAALIAAENTRRRQVAATDPDSVYLRPIVEDDSLRQLLTRAGLTLESRLAAGVSLRLRQVSNVALGGRLEDRTAVVHPDVRKMAEAIARALRLYAVGLDFITPDISRSWRELPCAVVEVNSTPGLSWLHAARRLLASHFPIGQTGRIPTLLALALEPAALAPLRDSLQQRFGETALVTAQAAELAGLVRDRPLASLAERVRGALSDPACAALLVSASLAEIHAHGLPLDRFSRIVLPEHLARDAHQGWLRRHADQVLAWPHSECFNWDGAGQ